MSNSNLIQSIPSSKTFLQLITCPICLEIFREPLQLPCQHSFCKLCLERITTDRWGRCPVCRACYRVPLSGISSFEINRTIVDLLETYSHPDNRPQLQGKCALCKFEETIAICEHCREAICCRCRREHYEDFRQRVTSKLDETQKRNEDFLQRQMEKLKKHEENVRQSKEIHVAIREKVVQLIDLIKTEETKLLKQIDEFQLVEQKLIDEKHLQINDLTSIERFCSKSRTILEKKDETDEEAIEIQQISDDYSNKIDRFHDEILIVKTPIRRISFYNREISFDAISLGFLELKNEFEPINIDVQLPTRIRTKSDESIDCSKTFLRYLVSSSLQKHHDESIVVQKNRKRSTQIIGKRGSGENEFLHPSSLAFSARDELIYLCDSFNNRLITFTSDGVLQQIHSAVMETGQRRFHYPYAVHIDDENRLYLIDQSERRIKVFDRDFNLIRLVGQSTDFSAPSDLCTNEEKSIFVCDAGSHRILKFNDRGEFLLAWGGLGNENGQLKCPACISILNNRRLAVSDWGNHRIQIFNYDGDHLLSLGQRGKLLAEFQRPLGLTFDWKTLRLFVCDEGNDRVMIFNEDMTTTELLTSKISFDGPHDIVFGKNNRIFVCEDRAHRLQIL